MTDKQDTSPSRSATLPPPCERLPCHKSSVCSRSYFVLVMVFFHVYILNVIALLFYVHYSNGQEDADRVRDALRSQHQHQHQHRRPESGSPPSKPEFPRHVPLSRVEGIRVSNVMMHRAHSYMCWLSLCFTHRHTPSTTTSLYPFRWDMSRGCHWCRAECTKCGLWVSNLCCSVRRWTAMWPKKVVTHPHEPLAVTQVSSSFFGPS